MDDKYLRRHREELRVSSNAITPVCIVVDTSHSMVDGRFVDARNRTRMDRLNEGIEEFLADVKANDYLSDSLEIAIVTFNTETQTELSFSTVDNIRGVRISGGSNAGDTPKGVEAALDILEREKAFLKSNGKKSNQPWIVIMSDGRATPGREAYDPITKRKDFSEINGRLKRVQERVRDMEARSKLTVIPVLISERSDGQYNLAKQQMQGFTNSYRCKEIGDGESQSSFKDFFKVLSRSVSVSNADIMFSDSCGGDARSCSANVKKDDYLSAATVAQMLPDRKIEDSEAQAKIELAVRAKEPEIYESDGADEEMDESEEIYENEEIAERDTEDLSGSEGVRQELTVPLSTATVEPDSDDGYIDTLLASLDDWDKI